MKLTINHLTHYHYDEEVKFSTQYLRLTPKNSARQQIREWKLTLPASAVATTDAYGNVLHVMTLTFRITTSPSTLKAWWKSPITQNSPMTAAQRIPCRRWCSCAPRR